MITARRPMWEMWVGGRAGRSATAAIVCGLLLGLAACGARPAGAPPPGSSVHRSAPAPTQLVAGGLAAASAPAVLLASGTVLLPGGDAASGPSAGCWLVDPASGSRRATGQLLAARRGHTASLLPTGEVLVVGGEGGSGPLASAELYDPAAGTWRAAPPLQGARAGHTATLLSTGDLLVTGGEGAAGALASTELFDPAAAAWLARAPLGAARSGHAATALPGGAVIVSGGRGATLLASVERYDPVADLWLAAPPLLEARAAHVAALLGDGRVLVAGGEGGAGALATAELLDVAGTAWSPAPPLAAARTGASATSLPSGEILVSGGDGAAASLERFDPVAGAFLDAGTLARPRAWHAAVALASGRVLLAGGTDGAAGAAGVPELVDRRAPALAPAGAPLVERTNHTATLLLNGRVLVAGGEDPLDGYLASAELFDPATGAWSVTGRMNGARAHHAAVLLSDGQVLVVGGLAGPGAVLATAERYDPSTGTWTRVADLLEARGAHTATLLPWSGGVLVAGGLAGTGEGPGATPLATSEVYDPYADAWRRAGSLAAPRSGHAAVTLPSGEVLLVGGLGPGGPLGSTQRFDPYFERWGAGPALAAPRTGATATCLPSGEVLVVGGEGAGGAPLASVERCGPYASACTAGPALPTARAGHTATLLTSDEVLVTGGLTGGAPAASAVRLDAAGTGWSAPLPLAAARAGHVARLLPSGRVLLVGGGAGAETFDDGRGGALPPRLTRPQSQAVAGEPLALAGAGLDGGPGGATLVLRAWRQDTDLTAVFPWADRADGAVTATPPLTLLSGWYWVQPIAGGRAGEARPVFVGGASGPEWRLSGSGCGTARGLGPMALLLASLALARLRRRGGLARVAAGRGAPALLLALLLWPGQASAASTAFEVERYQPQGGAFDLLGVASARTPEHLAFSLSLDLSHADAPLRFVSSEGASLPFLRSQTALHLSGGVGLFGWGEVAVATSLVAQRPAAPLGLVPPGDYPAGSFGVSDVRLVPRVSLLQGGPFALAATLPLTIPAGWGDSYLGHQAFTGGARLVGEWAGDRWRVTGEGGFAVRPTHRLAQVEVGNALVYGLGAEVAVPLRGRTLSILGALTAEQALGAGTGSSPAEARAALRWPLGAAFGAALAVEAGGGVGIGPGYGTPAWRGLLAVRAAPAARSGAGLLGRWPRLAPPVEPPAAVPEEPTPVAEAPPPPVEPPEEPTPEPPPSSPLLPPVPLDLRIQGFAVRSDQVPRGAVAALDALAEYLVAHPELGVVAVVGHADETGPEPFNKWISELRAQRVKEHLVRRGVPAARLVSRGVGTQVPLVHGPSAKGHSRNRRVEFRAVAPGR